MSDCSFSVLRFLLATEEIWYILKLQQVFLQEEQLKYEVVEMIQRGDILSMEYLKKTEFTGCHQGMRYRLEGISGEDGKQLKVTVWPEPFNYFKTPDEKKQSALFAFAEEGVEEAVEWMNQRFVQDSGLWDHAWDNWTDYKME